MAKINWEPAPNEAEKLELAKSAKSNQIDQWREEAIAEGIAFDFDGETDSVQTRGNRDLANIQGLVTLSQMRVTNGDDTLIDFRSAENKTHAIKPETMISLGMAVQDHIGKQYEKSWSLKDQLAAITDIDSVNNLNWPSD